ncbi:hypothetical protein CTA2_5407 [Colletotrichum tanaceti]|uniref:N-acetyltransferase domain-containing protein n=1 Tax=Colletotrichum tanaceti TaxID=1306861 RepID=A0A4U6XQH0_9PEZI|nr:hypothetical protein CTA2_5407 [Colletotrichum tanaceti]TKW58067.1 hypothetical protein CTA1_11132 [Colletotrichum tanaceti]
MSNQDQKRDAKMKNADSRSYQKHGEDHYGSGRSAHFNRPGSPYPHTSNKAHHHQSNSSQSTAHWSSQGVSKQNTRENAQNKVLLPSMKPIKHNKPSKRTTSIRWAKDLPFPDRKQSTPSWNKTVSSPEVARSATESDSSSSDFHVKQQSFAVSKSFEKTWKKQEVEVVTKRHTTQKGDDKKPDTAAQQPSTTYIPPHLRRINEYVPPHLRMIKTKPDAEVDAPNLESENPNSMSYDADSESDTESIEPSKISTPLTSMALKDLPERQGVQLKSKKSHPSMDVSVEGDTTSSDERGSSRSSTPSDKTDGLICHGFDSASFQAWINNLTADSASSFLDEITDHHHHDVDPANGQLLERIEQPETIVNFEEEKQMRGSMIHRRRDWTSNLFICREIDARKGYMRRRQENLELRSLPARDDEPIQIATKSEVNAVSIAKEKRLLDDCVLRPAQLIDASGCSQIYNAAVADHDHEIVDTVQTSARRFEYMIDECQRERLPFVVAIKQQADLTDAKNWPSLNAYRQYMKWKESMPQEDESTENNICGFAYLKPYERGITGLAGSSSPTVKATVFVGLEHRRGGIGSALIHQLLAQTSILYNSHAIDFKWEGPAAEEDSFNTPDFRKIHRIIAHTMVKSEGEQHSKWVEELMTSFQFEKAGQVSQVYEVDSPHGVEWYDQVVWQHWANKIDTARNAYAGDESECSYDYPGKVQSPNYR